VKRTIPSVPQIAPEALSSDRFLRVQEFTMKEKKEKKETKPAQSRAEHLRQHKGISLAKRVEGKSGAAAYPSKRSGRKG